jgi:hypothetical protein
VILPAADSLPLILSQLHSQDNCTLVVVLHTVFGMVGMHDMTTGPALHDSSRGAFRLSLVSCSRKRYMNQHACVFGSRKEKCILTSGTCSVLSRGWWCVVLTCRNTCPTNNSTCQNIRGEAL